MKIKPGHRYVFNHAFSPGSILEDYEAHHGQTITVTRAAKPEDGFDQECLPQWFFVADDGWEGHAWPAELAQED